MLSLVCGTVGKRTFLNRRGEKKACRQQEERDVELQEYGGGERGCARVDAVGLRGQGTELER